MIGYVIRGRSRDRSRGPPRVCVPLVNLAFDAIRSVGDIVSVFINEHACTSNGLSFPISGTPPVF